MLTTLDVQRCLTGLGFDPGPLDGVLGRKTIGAIRQFQQARGLVADGIAGPVTLAALGLSISALPPWIAEAQRKMGLRETDARLKAYLKSDGRTLGDPAKLPWCGDFIETVIALTLPAEPMVANPYWARNWLKFGVEIAQDQPVMGAVGVVARGSGGHVFFVVGHDKTYWHALGGNQSNSVSIVRISKDRTLGLRYPATVEPPAAPLPFSVFTGAVSTNEA